MPKKNPSPKLVEDFLVPALNQNLFPGALMWENVDTKIFLLRWCHKSSSTWTENDAAVFVGWDKLKNRYCPKNEQYLMQAKQRFRAALCKLNTIEILQSADKLMKRCRIVKKSASRRKKVLSASPPAQDIPNSPLPSNDAVPFLYYETAMDEEQLSPASSRSNRDLEERSNLLIPLEDALHFHFQIEDVSRKRKPSSPCHVQEIPNSPLPSNDEAPSMYSETAMDEKTFSPASSSSNCDAKERSLLVPAEDALHLSRCGDYGGDCILNMEEQVEELLSFRLSSEQRENVLQEAEVSSSTSFTELTNVAMCGESTTTPQQMGCMSNNLQSTEVYIRIPEVQGQYFVQHMLPEPAGTNYNSRPSYDPVRVGYLVNYLKNADIAPMPPCDASAEVSSSIYEGACVSPPFLENYLDLEEMLDYNGVIPAL